jgi:heme exporter protein A
MIRFAGEALACRRGERLVFAGVDFALASGDALILTGRNGSGKTSLLRLAAGLTRPAAGRLAWHDGPVSDDPQRHRGRLHFVGHLDAVKPALTVAENLRVWASLRGAGEAAIRVALDSFGLGMLADAPARYLSAGQRRRLALSRLLAGEAPLWLLDEPTVALDRESVAAIHQAIARHRDGGGMAIIATNVELGIGGARRLALGDFLATEADDALDDEVADAPARTS